jgi:hypothetical protein
MRATKSLLKTHKSFGICYIKLKTLLMLIRTVQHQTDGFFLFSVRTLFSPTIFQEVECSSSFQARTLISPTIFQEVECGSSGGKESQ